MILKLDPCELEYVVQPVCMLTGEPCEIRDVHLKRMLLGRSWHGESLMLPCPLKEPLSLYKWQSLRMMRWAIAVMLAFIILCFIKFSLIMSLAIAVIPGILVYILLTIWLNKKEVIRILWQDKQTGHIELTFANEDIYERFKSQVKKGIIEE